MSPAHAIGQASSGVAASLCFPRGAFGAPSGRGFQPFSFLLPAR